MRVFRQFFVILLFCFLGELLHGLIPLQIPAGIYGLVLLFAALLLGLVKPDSVKAAAKGLIAVMPVLFIPAGVGLMESWEALRPMLLPAAVILAVSTVLVMIVSGKTTQLVMEKEREKNK